METYIALLRAVNVGGHAPVRMSDLVRTTERAGYTDVRTLLQSGNLVFRGPSTRPERIERSIEDALRTDLGRSTDVMVRSAPAWRRVLNGNPFASEAKGDPARLHVLVLKHEVPPQAWRTLNGAIVGRERAVGAGSHGYVYYPDGAGRSRLTPAIIGRSLGVRSTARNWNTVSRLDRLASE